MRRYLLTFSLLILVAPVGTGLAQEKKDLPSQKTRDAVEKFQKAPAGIGQAIEGLTDALKEKLGVAPEAKPAAKAEVDLTVPTMKAGPALPRYSAGGRRDPFQPFGLKAKAQRRPRESLSPLERYEIGQLKLVGVVSDPKEPRAMIEDSSGLGYIVKVGTPIGPDEGKVRAIKRNEVVIEETYIDFYGARKVRQVSMRMAAE
jgi:type IV pilus assembly protein PilP